MRSGVGDQHPDQVDADSVTGGSGANRKYPKYPAKQY